MTMTTEELKAKLDAHKLWLETRASYEVKGERLDLHCADLAYADLHCADLTDAKLSGADLAHADLTCADLTDAKLSGADLTSADLSVANLTDADLTDADLTSAYLDYSAWPLRYSSLDIKIDKRLAAQLMYHAMRPMWSCKDDASVAAVLARPECVALANQFHRVNECGRLEVFSSERNREREATGNAAKCYALLLRLRDAYREDEDGVPYFDGSKVPNLKAEIEAALATLDEKGGSDGE